MVFMYELTLNIHTYIIQGKIYTQVFLFTLSSMGIHVIVTLMCWRTVLHSKVLRSLGVTHLDIHVRRLYRKMKP